MRNRNELTEREKEILRLIAGGYEYKDIAKSLGLSVASIQNRVVYIMFKLNAINRTHAVVTALRNQVIAFDNIKEYE